MSFSFKDRQAALASLAANPPELLIIGGGVVGCSIAAHAAHLGLDVVLLEKEDIASGASGNSTGLAHAGLRYLAQGRVAYVFHEGHERYRLEELAPQWVKPFNFILPVYKGDPYPFWMVRLGTLIYDVLGWMDALLTKRAFVRRHEVLSAEAVKTKTPGIRAEGLLGGIEYYVDAKLQDSRFTLGYAQQAAQRGARIVTHAEVTSIITLDNGHSRIVGRDLLSGQSFELASSLVINAAGAWIDGIRRQSGMNSDLVQKSKGIHLIVDHIADSPLIMSSSAKGKVFFIIPIDSKRTLVGTTDTAVSMNPDQVTADSRDVMELLQQLFHFFPHLFQGSSLLQAIEGYKKVHVRDVYWGVRPLLLQTGSTLAASREYKLVKDLKGFWSFPGVKLTAGRAAGYEAAVEAWNHLRPGISIPAVNWDCLPGGELGDKQQANSEALHSYLISLYGTRYVEVLQWAQREPRLREAVLPDEPWILAEVAYSVHEEMVLTLNDFLWRRTKWSHYRDLPDSVVKTIAQTLGSYLSLAEIEIQKQMMQYQIELKKHRL